jgi:predicted alpha/beta hydrolase family esterase
MKTAYIFHDAFNDQFSDWYPWMKTELEKLGYVTFVPQFPTPAGQSYQSWRAVMKNYIDTFDGETILIGHGTGGTFALRLAQELTKKIRGVFLVASYAEPIGHAGYDRINTAFFDAEFNWGTIKNNVQTVGVITGSDDPFVPMEITERLAKNLGQTVVTIPDGGHMNRASGFIQAVPLLHAITEQLRAIDVSMTIEQVPDESEPETRQVSTETSSPENKSDIPGETKLKQQPDPSNGQVVSEKKSDHNPAIHTMYQDMSHLVNSNQGRVASSLLGEARAQEKIKKEKSPMATKNILYIIATLIVIGAGIGALGYVFFQFLPAQQQAVVPKPASLIPAETYETIELGNLLLFEIQEKIQSAAQSPASSQTVHDIIFLEQGTRATFSRVLQLLDIRTFPVLLAEQFGITQSAGVPLFMYGKTMTQNTETNQNFLIVPFISYDTLFLGMSQWEPTLVRDLGLFIGLSDSDITRFFNQTEFSDEIIQNKPTRVFRDETGAFILGYFFLNQKTVVFINDPELIPVLIKRFANREIYN